MHLISCTFARPTFLASAFLVPLALVAVSATDAQGQGFGLRGGNPNSGATNNFSGFNRPPSNNLFGGMQRNRGFNNSPGFNNTQGFSSNNNMNIASGVLGIIGGAINAANQSNRNSFSGGGTSRAPMMVPNNSGRNNYNGFSSNQMFYSSPSSNSWSSSSSRRYVPSGSSYGYTRTVPSGSSSSYRSSYPSSSSIRYSSEPANGRIVSKPAVDSYVPSTPPTLDALKASLPVKIRCPEEETGIFSYQLISRTTGKVYDYTMTPGQMQEFSGGSNWKIRFDQGQGQGTKTYDLAGGEIYQARKDGENLWGVYAQ